MRRVVVTGMGIVSPIGNDLDTVLESLRTCRSGIVASPDQVAHNFSSQVYGRPFPLDWRAIVPRKPSRFMSEGIAWAYCAMWDAILDAGMDPASVSDERIGLVVGSGGPSVYAMVEAARKMEAKNNPRAAGPFEVPKTMSSGPSANLAVTFGIKGTNLSVSSACSTSAHCIGNAALRIRYGLQDMVFAGGCEELDWRLSGLFDAMGAMSSGFNATPSRTPRAYDKDRDGFVIAGGAGMLVLEEMEHAKARGARIYGELLGYGENSDGYDMVQPSGEGAVRCMNLAMNGHGRTVGYVNTHGTATPIGDVREIEAIRNVFGNELPLISSTKSITGHSLGAAGVWEAIFSLLMLKHQFVCESANIDKLDPAFEGVPIVRKAFDVPLDAVMSNSFGFGGTNATLVFGAV